MQSAVSLLGLLAMVAIAWCMSTHRSRFQWRVVLGGVVLQFVFAAFILRTEVGRLVFEGMGDAFNALVSCVDHGTDFMFDFTAQETVLSSPTATPPTAEVRRVHLLVSVAFRVLPTIVFFSALMSMLYYLGVMQRIVEVVAWVMQRTLGTSGAESLSAAANIFVGQTEAPLVVRPYVPSMTLSELNSVMVGGFATIAGGVLAAYAQMGIDAGHLITASVISAPAALLIAKVMVPETDEPQTMGMVRIKVDQPAANLVQAAADGAADGMKLAINVAAMLIAFLALVAMCNLILGAISVRVGFANPDSPWRLEQLVGFLFYPFAWLMGIPSSECWKAAELLGMKTVTNEFLAYDELARLRQANLVSSRTAMILTYALCGFANLGSIGIQIGGIGSLAESRRGDLARLGFRAMIGGTLASFMTACVAAILVPQGELVPIPQVKHEAVREQLRQPEGRGDDLGVIHVDEPNHQVGIEFCQDLPTRPARCYPPLSHDGQFQQVTTSCGHGARHGGAFGTYRQAIGLVLDVASREQCRGGVCA